ncbi:MAG: flagellar biosynthesis protein FliQ [Lachnospiraceae bacterium]|nr:flagellar biosynthesis protein FliQ [Lachnospiraceae bacterium]
MITQGEVLDITREGFMTVIMTALPILLVSLVVGLVISVFQTITSIQEQTLTFVPKILAAFAVMMLLGSWMLDNMTTYMTDLWNAFAYYLN